MADRDPQRRRVDAAVIVVGVLWVSPGALAEGEAIIVGPVLTSFVLPFNDEGSRNLARELTGGIEIASVVPGGD